MRLSAARDSVKDGLSENGGAKRVLLEQWKKYEEMLSIMGQGRNSYSKTDTDAIFMRMKEDHMRNGQLKPGYSVQIAENSEYITGLEVFSDRADVKMLQPMLNTLSRRYKAHYEEVVADAGYESLENYPYLEQNGQMYFIKPINLIKRRQASFASRWAELRTWNMTPRQTALPVHRVGSCI